MKIVITKDICFHIPINVIKRYFEIIGVEPIFYERKMDYTISPPCDKYLLTETPKDDYSTCIVTKNFGEECTSKEIFSNSFVDMYELERNDINLVKAVEELNPKNLKVVEIPDDVKWYIYESEGGTERIHEEHRVWY